jgi:hypothetical protein
MRARAIAAWCTAAMAAAACSASPTAPGDSPDDTVTSPAIVTFVGAVGPGGTAARTFTARLNGVATASLSAIAPATPLIIGLGVPRPDGTGCLLARSATAADGAAARVTATVDAGTFCAQVLAPAQAAESVGFSVTLEFP